MLGSGHEPPDRPAPRTRGGARCAAARHAVGPSRARTGAVAGGRRGRQLGPPSPARGRRPRFRPARAGVARGSPRGRPHGERRRRRPQPGRRRRDLRRAGRRPGRARRHARRRSADVPRARRRDGRAREPGERRRPRRDAVDRPGALHAGGVPPLGRASRRDVRRPPRSPGPRTDRPPRTARPASGGRCQAFSAATRRSRRRAIAAVCICEMRDSVTPRIVPISARVMFWK